jgi:ribosomal protein S18 acetylase RimI-like enzyme
MSLTLRSVQADDEDFLFALYCSARADEVVAWGWDDAQREAFLRMQFRAQQQHYQTLATPAERRIVCRDDRPIGWIATVQEPHALRLADIALLAAERNQGIGTALIRELLAEAARIGVPVQLQVLRHNRAVRLYQRLGFTAVDDNGVYLAMERRPEVDSSAGIAGARPV